MLHKEVLRRNGHEPPGKPCGGGTTPAKTQLPSECGEDANVSTKSREPLGYVRQGILEAGVKRRVPTTARFSPLVLYYPTKSQYEPVHEAIPVYYELPNLGEESKSLGGRVTNCSKCVYSGNKRDQQYQCLVCLEPYTPWRKYTRCKGATSHLSANGLEEPAAPLIHTASKPLFDNMLGLSFDVGSPQSDAMPEQEQTNQCFITYTEGDTGSPSHYNAINVRGVLPLHDSKMGSSVS
ncbi:hypothetical protein FRC08_001296 [Ceratobasidium sp. 394]|nr:hypothetical protein FRC08_001296 [Ceratobasidium sp. 394]